MYHPIARGRLHPSAVRTFGSARARTSDQRVDYNRDVQLGHPLYASTVRSIVRVL